MRIRIFDRTFLQGLCLCGLSGLFGCSNLELPSLEQFGNRVLKSVGYAPAATVFESGKAIVNATQRFSAEEEYYFGRAVAARIISIYPLYEDEAISKYLNKVGLSVSYFSDRPDTFGGYHFAVLNSQEINAISAPGGFVFITKGMLDLIPNEDTLAAVLAHEVVHVASRHGMESISEANLTELAISLGQLAGSLNCAEVMQEATLIFGGAVEDVVDALVEKGYSRELEHEADAGATVILQRAGYDAHSIFLMLREIEKFEGGKTGGWLSTHPKSRDRSEVLVSFLQRTNVSPREWGKAERSARFKRSINRRS